MKKNGKRKNKITFAFFGTSHIAVYVLDELERAGFLPYIIVTTPDTKSGRGMKLAPPPVKPWALARRIDVLQPENFNTQILKDLSIVNPDIAILVDYGKIIPKELLEVPRRGFLNVHASLLPRLRGASPIRSAILHDEKITGVSIIELDEQMDHGALVAQKRVDLSLPAGGWPVKNSELERILLTAGGQLLAQILPQWVEKKIDARPQNHDVATYCEKIKKEDGLLDLDGDPYKNLLKIRAFEGWPGTYAFFERNGKRIRVGILDAHLDSSAGGRLIIDKVKPEGKREMGYEEFLRSGAKVAATSLTPKS